MGYKRSQPLARGQIWKTGAADIEIVSVGKRLIHYRVIRQLGARQVSTQISGIEAMSGYLLRNQAVLMGGAARN